MSELPVHSPLGASGAKRWMECPGSATLIRLLGESIHDELGLPAQEEPEWTREGIKAHELAAYCLNEKIDTWQAEGDAWALLTQEMMAAVQVYVNFVRSIRGYSQQFIEFKLHRSEFHPWCFGTVDCAVQDRKSGLHIVDYKHGEGVVVEVEENPQLMYYAFMVIDELDDFSDDEPVTLTIVQPRVEWHPDGAIRSWTTTVGRIKEWAWTKLRPAMERTAVEGYLATGEHCRFCPAKRICPAFLNVAGQAAGVTMESVKAMSNQQLAYLLELLPVIRMAPKVIMAEAKHRTINAAQVIPHFKIVPAMADRMWKSEAPVADKFGYQPAKVKSVTQVEKEPGGKEFVAEWAFRPDAGYDLVHESDRRKPVNIEPSQETFKKLVDNQGND